MIYTSALKSYRVGINGNITMWCLLQREVVPTSLMRTLVLVVTCWKNVQWDKINQRLPLHEMSTSKNKGKGMRWLMMPKTAKSIAVWTKHGAATIAALRASVWRSLRRYCWERVYLARESLFSEENSVTFLWFHSNKQLKTAGAHMSSATRKRCFKYNIACKFCSSVYRQTYVTLQCI